MTDAAIADRIQFAFTILFHYVFPVTTMGLAPVIVYFKTMHLRTVAEKYSKAAQFWARIFAINFAAGVVTGIPMEFQFGTNWASFSNFAGGVVGQTLAMEGIFAFFLESGFLGLFLFGEGRISPFLHRLSALLLGVGAWLSGFFITATDAWMQHPVGYTVQNGRAHLTSFWALLGNPFAWWQYVHVINGALVAGFIGIAAIGAFYLLARREQDYELARLSVSTGVVSAAIFSITQVFPTGDMNARNVVQYQKPKQAAYEGLFKSQANAPLGIFGFPSMEQHRLLVTSSGLLLTLLVSTGIGLYPYLLPSNPHPERSFTIYNSYSSHFALQVGLTWLAFGLTLALAHTGWVYYLFKGKVKLEAGSHY